MPFCSSPEPILEQTIINDTGIGPSDSIEIVDTDDSINMDQCNVSTAKEKISKKKKKRNKKSSKKTHRPCPFCPDNKMQSALSRHIQTKHKTNPEVVKAMKLTKVERIKKFREFRKEGSYQHNRKEMAKDNPQYIRERN